MPGAGNKRCRNPTSLALYVEPAAGAMAGSCQLTSSVSLFHQYVAPVATSVRVDHGMLSRGCTSNE